MLGEPEPASKKSTYPAPLLGNRATFHAFSCVSLCPLPTNVALLSHRLARAGAQIGQSTCRGSDVLPRADLFNFKS